MSSLWTPGGERPIRRDPDAAQPGPSGGPRGGAGTADRAAASELPEGMTPEEMQARMAELQEQLARTPANLVVANHAFGLFELAALHLSLQPPQLDQARLAIDALAALVEGLGSRLGDHAEELKDGLSQLRMAYVQINTAQQAANGRGGQGGGDGAESQADPG